MGGTPGALRWAPILSREQKTSPRRGSQRVVTVPAVSPVQHRGPVAIRQQAKSGPDNNRDMHRARAYHMPSGPVNLKV